MPVETLTVISWSETLIAAAVRIAVKTMQVTAAITRKIETIYPTFPAVLIVLIDLFALLSIICLRKIKFLMFIVKHIIAPILCLSSTFLCFSLNFFAFS